MHRMPPLLLGLLLLVPSQDRAEHAGRGRDGARHAEVARVRAHLLGAEQVLLARNLGGISARQRDARRRCLDELRAYRQRGIFPHNHGQLHRRTPVFVDEHGTRCAMAWLIERSGDAGLVRHVATTRNLATIRELADEPELVAWLDRNGLSLEEAARIQPEYGLSLSVEDDERRHAVLGGFGAAVGALGTGLNVIGSSPGTRGRVRAWVGITMGLSSAAMGLPALEHEGGVRAIGILDLGLGLLSTGLGLRQLHHSGQSPSLVGTVTPSMWRDERGTRRVALTARF